MKRYFLIAASGGIAIVLLLSISIAVIRSRPHVDERMARGRALVETENYLSALEVLRAAPTTTAGQNGITRHEYLGAAYLQLHLYQAAIDEFQEAAKQSPRALDALLGLASTYIRLGDGRMAVEEAVKAAKIGKDSIDVWLILGRAHWFQRDFAEAEKAGLKIQELEPGSPQAVELLLRVYFDEDEPAKFQSLLDRMPEPTKPIMDLAAQFFVRQAGFRRAYEFRIRSEKRSLEHQILETQLALAREPSRMELYPSLVRNLVKMGRFDEASVAARSYRGEIPLDLELGKAYQSLGNKDEALRAYQRASAAGTHKLSAEVAMAVISGDSSSRLRHWQEAFRSERIERDYFVLAQLEDVLKSASPIEKTFIYRYAGVYDAFFYNKAAEQALAVLNAQPAEFDALMTIATAYQRLGRMDDSARYVEVAKAAYPNRAEVWERLGGLALAQKDVQHALQCMEKAAQLEPTPTNLYNVGWIHDQSGATAQAVSYYERAIAASSLSFEAMNNLALIQQNAGRPDQALKLLQRSVAANPEDEAAYFNLAEYYSNRRLWSEALDNYRRILDLNPVNAGAAVDAGRILIDQDRVDDAIEKLNQALDVDAHSFDAYIVLSSAYEKMGRRKEALAALDEAKRIRPDDPELQKAKDRLKA
jgi:tetratricopeptide (TPR) repeat protein